MTEAAFAFPPDTTAFLSDLRRHNDKNWFDANRDRYESSWVAPAKEFVDAIRPALQEIVPGIRAEARVLGSIFRINRDTRFSADKRPYKDHLDFWFWGGERRAAVSGLFLRISPDGVTVGAGAHGFDKGALARYRAAVGDPTTGSELAGIVAALEADGSEIGGETYRRTPRGYDADGATARLLRHSALYVHAELAADSAISEELPAVLLRHWTTFAPLHHWLTTNV